MTTLCRCCRGNKAKKDIHEKYEMVLTYADLIKNWTDVKISKRDSLPQTICDLCYYQVKTMFEFRSVIYKSNEQLRQPLSTHLNNKQCRCCLSPNVLEEYNIHDEYNHESTYAGFVKSLTGLTIGYEDGLSQKICIACVSKFQNMSGFGTNIRNADKLMRKEKADLKRECRCCQRKSAKKIIHGKLADGRSYAEFIHSWWPHINIRRDDGRPQGICDYCWTDCNERFAFAKKISDNDKELRKQLQFDVKKQCRCCLSTKEEKYGSIHDNFKSGLTIAAFIERLSGVKTEDNLPQVICARCYYTVMGMNYFPKKPKRVPYQEACKNM